MLSWQNPWGEMRGLRGKEASLIFLNFRSITCGEVVKFSSWVRFGFLFNKTFTRFNAHCTLHIFLRLSLCFFVGRVQPFLLFTVSLSHFFNSGWNASLPGARGFFHWNSCLEVFDKKQKHLWIHKSNSPFESKGNSVLFLRFVFLGKVESQRNCSIPKRVKKELPVYCSTRFFSHIPPKNPTKKTKTFRFFLQKTGWSLGMRLSSQRWCCGAVAVDRCCLFSHLSSLHLFHGWLFHRDRWGWRLVQGVCVSSPRRTVDFQRLPRNLVAKEPK